MATFQRHLIGRRANVMLNVSILMYRAEGCAVLRRAELAMCSIALWIEPSFASKLELPGHIAIAPELIDRGTCQEDAPRNVPRDAPGDVPGDVPWALTAGRAKGTRYGTTWGQAFRSRHLAQILMLDILLGDLDT